MRFKLLVISLLFAFSGCSDRIFRKAMSEPYDAIIVPGVPFDGKEWSEIMKMRVYWSYILYKNGIAKNIIYSGSAVYTPYTESKIMKLYALELGIPEEVIYTDTLAEHSTENLYYSNRIAGEAGFKKLALATDFVQNRMLRSYRHSGRFVMDALPISMATVKRFMELPSPKIDPSQAFVRDFISLAERESAFKRFKGTLGLNIDYE